MQRLSRLGALPVLVVGNKTDQVNPQSTRAFPVDKDFGVEAIYTVSAYELSSLYREIASVNIYPVLRSDNTGRIHYEKAGVNNSSTERMKWLL